MTPYTQVICGHQGTFEVSNLSSGNTHPADWFIEWATGAQTSDAGVRVNGYTALTYCPLWQGVNIISGDLGQVPIRLVKDKFYDQRQHNAWKLLRVRPNELQTPSVWKETMIQWALIWGNAVAWTPRTGARITDLIPLRPDCLWPELVAFDDGQVLLYHYNSPTRGHHHVFFPDEVVHIQGLTGDGIWGYELFQIAKNTIGHGLALEKHGNKSFSNGARPSGVLKHPGKLDEQARRNLRREWNAIHEGPENSGKIAILMEAMEFQALSMTNIDAQWIEARKMDAVDAARLLNLPAYKLNAQESLPTQSNIEEQNETYKQMTLTRWSNRLDEEFRRKLLTTAEWESDRYRFVPQWDAFMEADVDTKSLIADRNVKATIWNPNEAREYLGYLPREGGDVYGSPAINPNPQAPPNAADSPDNGRPKAKAPDSAISAAHFDLLKDRIGHLFEIESHNLKRATDAKLLKQDGDAKNFVEWLDVQYEGNGSPSKFMGLFDSIVGKSLKAAESAGLTVQNVAPLTNSWALERRRAILEACSHVTAKDLPSAIEAFLSSPGERAQALLTSAAVAPASVETAAPIAVAQPPIQPASPPIVNVTCQLPAIPAPIINLPEQHNHFTLPAPEPQQQLAPVVNVNVESPTFNTPPIEIPQTVVNVKIPKSAPPVVNVTTPEVKLGDIHVQIPENPAPIVNIAPPEVTVNPPDVIVNVPEQKPPTVNVTNPEVTVNVPESHVTVNVPELPLAPPITVNMPKPIPPGDIITHRDPDTNLVSRYSLPTYDIVPERDPKTNRALRWRPERKE